MEDLKAEEGRSRSSSMSDSTASGISLLGRGSTAGGSGKRESALDSLEKKRRESVNSRLKDLQESLHQKKEPEEAESSPISLPVIVRLKTRPIQPLPPTTRKLEQLTRRSTSYEQVIASAFNRGRPASVSEEGAINSESPLNGSARHTISYPNAAENEVGDRNTSNHIRRPLQSLPDVEGESEAVLNVSRDVNSFKVSEDMKQNILSSHKLKLNNPDTDLEAAELPTTTSVVSPSDEMVARWLQNQTEEIILSQLSNNIDTSDLENNIATCHDDSNEDFIINANETRIVDSKSLSNYQADTIKTFQPYSAMVHSNESGDNLDANYSNTLTGDFSTPQVDRSVSNCDKTFDEISSKKKIRIVQDYNADELNSEAKGERSGMSSASGNRNKQLNDKCSPTKKVQFMLENEQPLGSTAKTASHRVHFNDDEIVKNNSLDLSIKPTAFSFPNTHKFDDYTRGEPKEDDLIVKLTTNENLNSNTDSQRKQQHVSSERYGDRDIDWTNDFQQRLNVIRQRIINIDENKIQNTNEISTRHSLQTFKHDEPEQIQFSSARPKSENFHVKTETDSSSSNDFDSVRAKMLSLISTIPSYASKSQMSSKKSPATHENIDKSIPEDNYSNSQKSFNLESIEQAPESVSSINQSADYKNDFDFSKCSIGRLPESSSKNDDNQNKLKINSLETRCDSNYSVKDIIVQKSRLGLGFSIEGGRNSSGEDRPIVVKRIFQSGKTEMCSDDLRPHVGQSLPTCGQLRTGDEILAADGHSLSELSQYTAWNFLKSLPDGKVRLTIRREINKDGGAS